MSNEELLLLLLRLLLRQFLTPLSSF